MQLSNFILAAVSVVAVAADVTLPPCGSWCTNNITNSPTTYGCQSSTDFRCLCTNVTFGFAVHDCAQEYCQNDTAADIAVAWAVSVCSSASVPIKLPPASASITPVATAVNGGPVTSTVVSTVTSGGSTFTTSIVVSSTVAGAGATPTGSASATEDSGSASGSETPSATVTSIFTSVFETYGSTVTSTGETTLVGGGGPSGSPSGSNTATVTGTAASPTESASSTDASGSVTTPSGRVTSTSASPAAAMPTRVPGAALILAGVFAAAMV